MNHLLSKGFSFGLTSGIITTLGLMMGLHSSTGSSAVVISGILVIALADGLSDALGVHISEEAEGKQSHKEVWNTTIHTFLSKFIFAIQFVIPILIFSLETAIYISVAWGLFLISLFSFYMAKSQKTSPFHVVGEHLFIAIFVIIATHYIGDWTAGLK